MNTNDKRIEMVRVSKLRFDSENPRLPSSIDSSNKNDILDWMLKGGALIELMASIGTNGYFAGEPLLITPANGEDYIVVEGNRRLAASMLLIDPELAPKRKRSSVSQVQEEIKIKPAKEIPCVIYKRRNEIMDYLGYRHVTGIKTWGPLAKAKYLKQLSSTINITDQQETFRELARKIGSRADYVARLLAGLAIYDEIANNDFFDIKELNEESIEFSLITTAMNYSNMVKFLGMENASDPSLKRLDIDKLNELTHWIFKKSSEGVTRVGESRNLKTLSSVIENKSALNAFRSGKTLSEAAILTEEPTTAFRISINNARKSIQTARNTIHLVNNPTESDVETLYEVQIIARDLIGTVKNRLTDEESI